MIMKYVIAFFLAVWVLLGIAQFVLYTLVQEMCNEKGGVVIQEGFLFKETSCVKAEKLN